MSSRHTRIHAETRTTTPAAGPTPISMTLPVKGMTCRSCEVRIAKSVGRLPGVERVTASASRGRVVVESLAPVSAAEIERAINGAGYEVGRTPWLENDPKVWLTAGAGVLLVAGLALVAQVIGLTSLASGVGDLGSGGLVVALMLGLAAGVSTCAALVGGLVLALSASFQAGRASGRDADASLVGQMRPALVFVGGRIAGYAVLGAALGAIGASVTMPPQVTAVLMITVALVMAIIGTRLTGLSPRVAGWSPTLPMGFGRRLGLGGSREGGYSDTRAAGLGVASFFLPCGFTQAVQVYALSTGSPLQAGAIMAVFAIGTAPGLLALAGLPAMLPGAARPTLLRLVGVVVLGFAVLNGVAGLRLAGATLRPGGAGGLQVGAVAAVPEPTIAPSARDGVSPTTTIGPVPGSGAPTLPTQSPGPAPTPAQTQAPTPAPTPAGPAVQELRTYQDVGGYTPVVTTIAAGISTRWTIESRSSQTCAAFLVVPGLGIQMELALGDGNVIDLPPLKAGTLEYTCGMGMFWGSIVIEDRPPGTTGVGG